MRSGWASLASRGESAWIGMTDIFCVVDLRGRGGRQRTENGLCAAPVLRCVQIDRTLWIHGNAQALPAIEAPLPKNDVPACDVDRSLPAERGRQVLTPRDRRPFAACQTQLACLGLEVHPVGIELRRNGHGRDN